MYKREWEDKLKQLDSLLQQSNKHVELVIVGGAAFILSGRIDRSTEDIDTINELEPGFRELCEDIGMDVNCRVRIFKHLFIGWEDEQVQLKTNLNLTNLKLNTLPIEFLMATKFYTREDDRDISEVAQKNAVISKDKLEAKVKQIYDNTVSIFKARMYNRRFEIMELYRAKGWKYENSIVQGLLEEIAKWISREPL